MKKPHIVSFSGGAASFAVACQLVEKYGKDKVILVFCDTSIEDEDLYRFVDECTLKLDVEIIKLKDGRTPWKVFEDHRYQGNSRTAHCTVDLKGAIFARWIQKEYSNPNECVIYFGFDWSEKHRLETAKKNWNPYWCQAPLTLPPYLNRHQVFQYMDDYDIEIPKLYKLGFTHNNCGGFCVKAGKGHFANLLAKLPDVYKHHEKEQENLMKKIGPTIKPFLKEMINRKVYYLTLKDFRESIEAGKVFTKETEGCNCFSNLDANGIQEMLELKHDSS